MATAAKPEAMLSLQQARHVALLAQGLAAAEFVDGASSPVGLAETLESSGLVRTLGGVDVYLALRARRPSMTRADLDAAVAAGECQVKPSVRGCIYLAPRSMVAPSLRLADRLSSRRNARDQQRAGVEPGEVDELSAQVLEMLEAFGPSTTQEIRKRLPEGAVRSLGDRGKKVGLSSTLPPTLRHLEFAGGIERALEGGRLDTERYRWRIPATDLQLEALEDTEIDRAFAELFFRAAGFATVKGFAAWSGLSQTVAKKAMASLDLLPITIDGSDEVHWLANDYRPLIDQQPDPRGTAFLPFEDNLVALHGGPAFWVDAQHHHLPVPKWGRTKGSTLGDTRQAQVRSLVVDGTIRGFWELDIDHRGLEIGIFEPLDSATQKRVDDAAADVASFLLDDLGHGLSFSIDTEAAQRQRVDFLKSMGA